METNDHDLLIRMDTRLQDLRTDIGEFKIRLAQKCDKEEAEKRFETRMRKLERFFYIATGVLIFIQFLLNIN